MYIPFLSKKKEVAAEVKSATTPVQIFDLQQGSLLEGAFSGRRVSASAAFGFYRSNSALATAVDLIADSFEQIAPVLKIDGEFVSDHEVIKLLMQPNGFESWPQFAGEIARHYLLTHNEYIFGAGNVNRPPLQLFAVYPPNISTMEAIDKRPSSYLVSDGEGRGNYQRNEKGTQIVRYYDGNLKELFHTMGFSSRNSKLSADSPIEAILLDVKQQIAGRSHNLKLIQNGARLSLLVSFKDVIDADEHEERKQKIQEALGGAENAGKIAVTAGEDMTVKEFGQTNKDMDYAELESVASTSVYLRYRIPLPLVTVSASTLNNYEASIPVLYDQAVLPLAATIFSGLSKFLLPRYGLDPTTAQITHDPDSITALMSRRLDELKKRKDIAIETPNELRSLLPDRDDVENGDILYQPANLVPVGEDFEATDTDDDLLGEAGLDDDSSDSS